MTTNMTIKMKSNMFALGMVLMSLASANVHAAVTVTASRDYVDRRSPRYPVT